MLDGEKQRLLEELEALVIECHARLNRLSIEAGESELGFELHLACFNASVAFMMMLVRFFGRDDAGRRELFSVLQGFDPAQRELCDLSEELEIIKARHTQLRALTRKLGSRELAELVGSATARIDKVERWLASHRDFVSWPIRPNEVGPLETERLQLLPIERADAAQLHALIATDPPLFAFVEEQPSPDLPSTEHAVAHLVRGRSRDGRRSWLTWLARERRSMRLVGVLHVTRPEDLRSASIEVIAVFQPHRRSGYALEILLSLFRALFEKYAMLETIAASIDAENEPARALLCRAGMREVRIRKGTGFHHGRARDTVDLAIGRQTRWG